MLPPPLSDAPKMGLKEISEKLAENSLQCIVSSKIPAAGTLYILTGVVVGDF